MSEYISRYDFREQIEGVRKVRPKPTLFRSTFFNGPEYFSTTENIEWDEIRGGAPMAKYIHPRIPVAPTERAGFMTHEVRTPFIQEARIITADQLTRRQFNENIYDPISPAERAQQYRNADYAFCIDAIDNRVEQQCASMILQGRVDILTDTGMDLGHVDFGTRPLLTLTGGLRWGQAGVDPRDALLLMYNELLEDDYLPTRVLMGEGAYRLFERDPEVVKRLDVLRGNWGAIEPRAPESITSEIFKCRLTDPALDIFVYNALQTDPHTGVRSRVIPDNMVLLFGEDARVNRLMFGAVTIIDDDKNWQTVPGRYVPERRVIQDPPTERIQVTSRPLPTPVYPDSWYVAYVF